MDDNVNFSSVSSRSNILQGRVFLKHPEENMRGIPIAERLLCWVPSSPLFDIPNTEHLQAVQHHPPRLDVIACSVVHRSQQKGRSVFSSPELHSDHT